MVEIMGWFAIGVAVVVILHGAVTAINWLSWRYRWYRGDAQELKRSVKLGWNTGEPPEDQWFLVREHADDCIGRGPDISREYEWSLMKRIGDTCYTVNGGMTTPVRNITGWLLVIEEKKDGN